MSSPSPQPDITRRALLIGAMATVMAPQRIHAGTVALIDAEKQNHPAPGPLRKISQVHQILIVDGFGQPAELPCAITQRIVQLKRLYSDGTYTLWTGNTLRAFIEVAFDRDVLWAFDCLKPYAYKSDLGRLCLLYAFGGLYSDIMLEHHATLRIPSRFGLTAFRQAWAFRPYTGSVSNSLLWSEPHRPEWQIAIEKIVAHCRTQFYGQDRLEPTGPWLLGRACAAAATDKWRAGLPDDQWMGVHYADGPMNDMVFHTSCLKSKVVAVRPGRSNGDWSKSRLAGTNNYSKMWEAKDVYR